MILPLQSHFSNEAGPYPKYQRTNWCDLRVEQSRTGSPDVDQYSLAQQYFEESLALARDINNAQLILESTYALGEVAMQQQHYSVAKSHFQSTPFFRDPVVPIYSECPSHAGRCIVEAEYNFGNLRG